MVTLPRFGLEHSADLLGPLQTLGLSNRPLVFFGSKPPTISTISQRSVFQVTEAGAEAAAATAVTATRSLDDHFVKLVFDKPFVFALRDKTTGFVLVAGYVDRPEAAQSWTDAMRLTGRDRPWDDPGRLRQGDGPDRS